MMHDEERDEADGEEALRRVLEGQVKLDGPRKIRLPSTYPVARNMTKDEHIWKSWTIPHLKRPVNWFWLSEWPSRSPDLIVEEALRSRPEVLFWPASKSVWPVVAVRLGSTIWVRLLTLGSTVWVRLLA
jgi:hypothetical protein